MSQPLTRDDLISAPITIEAVPLPKLERVAHIREMSGNARDRYEYTQYEKGKAGTWGEMQRALLLSLTVCDESGKLLFSVGDIEAIGEKDASTLDLMFEKAKAMNGLGGAAVEEASKN